MTVWTAVAMVRLYAAGAMLLAAVLLFDAVTDRGFVAARDLLAIPLGAVVVIGTIGETVDSFGTASMTSDMVGALVIVAAAAPLILLATHPARRFRASDRG